MKQTNLNYCPRCGISEKDGKFTVVAAYICKVAFVEGEPVPDGTLEGFDSFKMDDGKYSCENCGNTFDEFTKHPDGYVVSPPARPDQDRYVVLSVTNNAKEEGYHLIRCLTPKGVAYYQLEESWSEPKESYPFGYHSRVVNGGAWRWTDPETAIWEFNKYVGYATQTDEIYALQQQVEIEELK